MSPPPATAICRPPAQPLHTCTICTQTAYICTPTRTEGTFENTQWRKVGCPSHHMLATSSVLCTHAPWVADPASCIYVYMYNVHICIHRLWCSNSTLFWKEQNPAEEEDWQNQNLDFYIFQISLLLLGAQTCGLFSSKKGTEEFLEIVQLRAVGAECSSPLGAQRHRFCSQRSTLNTTINH